MMNEQPSEKKKGSIFSDMRAKIEKAAAKKNNTSDSGADPDPAISLGKAKEEKKEKVSEENKNPISFTEIMKQANEEAQKALDDVTRLNQQVRVLREDEEKRNERVRLAKDILATPDDSDGQRTPAD